jgi:glycosyltransferase involved in cell wall biosynthesis
MHSAIVIPCLNEENIINSTCASLGFGMGTDAAPRETFLILVDNGSHDGTSQKMEEVKSRSPAGTVVIVGEPERGYVPARHRGVLEARHVAQATGISEQDFLILQADADTQYSPDYVLEMRAAASGRRNFLLEGTSDPWSGFDQTYSGYRALSERVDAPLQSLLVKDAYDVIVGDNIAGYLLSDYFAWGGHRREFNQRGDEIFAETSRLFIRAKICGARKLKVVTAIGQHSRRKISQHPVLHFATAGFPRELSWNSVWIKIFADYDNLEVFADPALEHKLKQAIFLRQAHSLIIFGLVPEYIALLLGELDPDASSLSFKELVPFLRGVSKEALARDTAPLFESAFFIIDSHQEALKTYLVGNRDVHP